jgi:Cof subfamily protein (haloacid dehalogenase superfamily)
LIKLAAFDVDGTLRDNSYLPESTVAALHELKRHGIVLALCTGRSEYEMASLRESLGIEWAVTCNGSHVGHLGETVTGHSFTKEQIISWWAEAERSNQTLLLYGAKGMFINRTGDPYFEQAQAEIGFMEPILVERAEELPTIYQCIIFCSHEDEVRYIGTDREEYYIHRWRTWAVDFNPKGMNKSVGLRELAEHLELDAAEVAVFGDGLNDIEMFEFAGMGIAMGNGIDKIKETALYVTKTLHEDGIAYAVNQWILPQYK